jgi:tRNA(fMet)-specific endonuclease VapC
MLDSNAAGAILAGNAAARGRYSRHIGAVGMSSIVLFELQYGLAKSQSSLFNRQILDTFFKGGVVVLPFETEDAEEAGNLRQKMEARGKPMGPYDLLIAAHVLRLNATLVTHDAAFSGVDGLKVEDWSI